MVRFEVDLIAPVGFGANSLGIFVIKLSLVATC